MKKIAVAIKNIKISATIAVICLLLHSCGAHKKQSIKTPLPEKSEQVKGETGKSTEISPATLALLTEARLWLGTKYAYGGNSRNGVDCSGLVMNIFNNALGIKLPRNSEEQMSYCTAINRKDLIEGDLVFFITGSKGKINHVGMYVGEDKMIHASTSKGVIISSLSDPYYLRNYHSSGRVAPYIALMESKESMKKGKNKETISPEQLRIDFERAIEEKTDSIMSEYFD